MANDNVEDSPVVVKKKGWRVHKTSDGGIWKSRNDRHTWEVLGWLVAGYCNVYGVVGHSKDFEEAVVVPSVLLRYPNRLGIKCIRLERTFRVMTPHGHRLCVRYGYLPVRVFKYMCRQRNMKDGVIILMKSDFTWRKK